MKKALKNFYKNHTKKKTVTMVVVDTETMDSNFQRQMTTMLIKKTYIGNKLQSSYTVKTETKTL
jgi:hypothetical protein